MVNTPTRFAAQPDLRRARYDGFVQKLKRGLGETATGATDTNSGRTGSAFIPWDEFSAAVDELISSSPPQLMRPLDKEVNEV